MTFLKALTSRTLTCNCGVLSEKAQYRTSIEVNTLGLLMQGVIQFPQHPKDLGLEPAELIASRSLRPVSVCFPHIKNHTTIQHN